jgi:uncharacterized protein (DUF1800 family)
MHRIAIGLVLTALITATGPAGLHAASVPTGADAVRHALNRLSFGPRPGDVERVRQMGLATWIERQLDPRSLDDSALAARLPAPPELNAGSPQEMRREARRSIVTLAQARLIRATYSERQLEELLVDFWFNHFNVFAGKGRTAIYLADYERDAIRPHVFGRFRDMLGATARHPAMLFYLDNWTSVDPETAQRVPQGANGQGRRRGLNENYARELLELHTLGVDNGYTQQDVVEVARAFTGWTIAPERQNQPRRARAVADENGFLFTPALHDRRVKTVLGRTLAANRGIEDGEQVLDLVAAHPSTARHIAIKLARRFVSDDPPASLVDRAAARFTATGGDLREVVRTIVTSDEFFAESARNVKVKTPLDFVVGAVRASGSSTANPVAMQRALQQLGMPLYLCQPPTGYDDSADAWVAPAALVTRINLARQLGGPQAELVASPAFQRK